MADKPTETDDIEVAFVTEFECPICVKYMFPPIRQCVSGHSFCSSCFDNINRCAICRAPKSDARCFVLEKMHSLLTFPCRYKEEGCDFSGKGESIKSHQNFCKYSAMTCPLKFNNCNWRGHKGELIPHCREEHPQNIYFNTRQKLVSSEFARLENRHYFILFHVYNTIFRCSWDVDKDTGLIRYGVYCLDRPITASRFSFEIAILLEDTNVEVVKLRGPCLQMKAHDDYFIPGKYLVAMYDMLKDYCDDDGDLNYIVKIYKNDT